MIKKIIERNYQGKFKKIFGFPNISKSITLIGQLKYNTNHKTKATLYINCKSLHNKNDKSNKKNINEGNSFLIPQQL